MKRIVIGLLLSLSVVKMDARDHYKLYVNVFKPVYSGDTAIFPSVLNFEKLEARYKTENLNVEDALVTIKEFDTGKYITLQYDKTRKAYYCEKEDYPFPIQVEKQGYEKQESVYLGNGHHDLYIAGDSSVHLVFYLFTKRELPLVEGKMVFPYRPPENKIVIRLMEARNPAIDSIINTLCLKYDMMEISDTSKPYTMDAGIDFGYYSSLVILKKKTGKFKANNCQELEEIRKYKWGAYSGPLLGYLPLWQTNGYLEAAFATNIIKGSLSGEELRKLCVARERSYREYISDPAIGLGIVELMYIQHRNNPAGSISNRSR